MALALSTMALGASAKPPQTPEFVRVEWLTRPTSDQIASKFDVHGSCHGNRTFTGGTADVECELMVNGRLKACVVTRNEPWDCAYGEISLSLTPFFQARPRLPDGRKLAPGMKVRLPFSYGAPEG